MVFDLSKRKKPQNAISESGQPVPAEEEQVPRYSFTKDRNTNVEDTKNSVPSLQKPNPEDFLQPSPIDEFSASTASTSDPTPGSLPPTYAAHARVTSQPRPGRPTESDYKAGFLWNKTPNLPTDPKPEPHGYSPEEVAKMERKGISPQLKWELDAYKREGKGKAKKGGFWSKVGMMGVIR